jgi:hypothetical protein
MPHTWLCSSQTSVRLALTSTTPSSSSCSYRSSALPPYLVQQPYIGRPIHTVIVKVAPHRQKKEIFISFFPLSRPTEAEINRRPSSVLSSIKHHIIVHSQAVSRRSSVIIVPGRSSYSHDHPTRLSKIPHSFECPKTYLLGLSEMQSLDRQNLTPLCAARSWPVPPFPPKKNHSCPQLEV